MPVIIINKFNCSIVGPYLLCAPTLQHSFGWYLLPDMPRGFDGFDGGSFSRSQPLRHETTRSKPTEKPTSVQDNWVIVSGLFKNKE